jgi:hypothetical protein
MAFAGKIILEFGLNYYFFSIYAVVVDVVVIIKEYFVYFHHIYYMTYCRIKYENQITQARNTNYMRSMFNPFYC